MLPSNNLVLAQVADISNTGSTSRLEDHPTDMSPPETVMSIIRIKVGIGVTMVSAMATGPPFDGAFNGTSTSEGEEVL